MPTAPTQLLLNTVLVGVSNIRRHFFLLGGQIHWYSMHFSSSDIEAFIWPYDEKEESHYVEDLTSYQALDLAYQVARGIADIHDVEEDGVASIGKLGRTYLLALPLWPKLRLFSHSSIHDVYITAHSESRIL